MTQDVLSAETTIARALEVNPALAARLTARRTACVGCCLARFCTLRDASNYYKIPLDLFVEELRSAASNITVPKE